MIISGFRPHTAHVLADALGGSFKAAFALAEACLAEALRLLLCLSGHWGKLEAF